MNDFKPVTLHKGDETRLAQSVAQLHQLKWDGWSEKPKTKAETKAAHKAAETKADSGNGS